MTEFLSLIHVSGGAVDSLTIKFVHHGAGGRHLLEKALLCLLTEVRIATEIHFNLLALLDIHCTHISTHPFTRLRFREVLNCVDLQVKCFSILNILSFRRATAHLNFLGGSTHIWMVGI